MEKDIKEIKNEIIISLKDARKQRKIVPTMNGNYLGYIDKDGLFQFITYDGKYLEVANTKTLNPL